MTDRDDTDDHCAVCGGRFGPRGAFCRFYSTGSHVSFCAPACATAFLRGPGRSGASPHGDFIAELVAEWKWTWGNSLRPAPAATGEYEIANGAEPAAEKRPRVVTAPKLFDLPSHENGSCVY